jgi:glycosyltransferase involved in cell wall biosynthesis
VKRRGIGGCVRMLGATNRIGDLLAVTDVLLVTSRTEGMPGVVIEAGMVGVPTVGYAVGSMPELVSHGDTGWLVTPGDSAALIAALEHVTGDPDLLKRLGKRAAELYREKFDLTTVAKSYLSMYRDIHSEPTTARVSLKG